MKNTKTEAPRVVDITPTWSGLLPAFIAIAEGGDKEGRQMVREELARMARAADLYNESNAPKAGPFSPRVGEALPNGSVIINWKESNTPEWFVVLALKAKKDSAEYVVWSVGPAGECQSGSYFPCGLPQALPHAVREFQEAH